MFLFFFFCVKFCESLVDFRPATSKRIGQLQRGPKIIPAEGEKRLHFVYFVQYSRGVCGLVGRFVGTLKRKRNVTNAKKKLNSIGEGEGGAGVGCKNVATSRRDPS